MKRIITQIVKALRSGLSRLGFFFVAPITPDKDQEGSVQQAALLPDDADKGYEGSGYQAVDEDLTSTLQESQVKESGKVGGVVEGDADSEWSGTETPEPLVQEKQAIQGEENSSELRDRPERDGCKGSIVVTSGHLSGDTVEHTPTPQEVRLETVPSSVEEQPRSETMPVPEAERELPESMSSVGGSDRHDETSREASVPLTVEEGGISKGSEDGDGSARAEHASTDNSRVDKRTVEAKTLQMDEEAARSDPHSPRDIDHEPTATIVSPQAEEAPPESTEKDESATANGRRVPSPRQARPPEDADEYSIAVQDVSAVDREYAHWNDAIVEQLILAGPASEEVLLCVNPRILARVFEEAGLGSITPEEAEQHFTTSVANLYQRHVLRYGARLHVLRRCSSDGYPDCVAFLAGSVLAAFRMQSDQELSGNAYYRRLADLLKCEMQGAHPSGFDPWVFESLWRYLANWLSQT